jgi:hypothetical protein
MTSPAGRGFTARWGFPSRKPPVSRSSYSCLASPLLWRLFLLFLGQSFLDRPALGDRARSWTLLARAADTAIATAR